LDQSSDDGDQFKECLSLISQTLENVVQSSGVLAMSPKQSSNPLTSVINHVEVLCHAIPFILEQLLISTTKLKQSEQLSTSVMHQNQALQMKLEMMSQQESLDLLAAETVEYKKQLHELEETNRALVNNDANTLNNTQRLLYVCLNFATGFGVEIYKNGSA
jgi:hypothetical protein